MASIRPPGNLIVGETTYSDFLLWLEAFNDFVSLTKDDVDVKLNIKLFLSIGGLELRKLVNNLQVTDDKFSSTIAALKKYFKPVTNFILERHRFFNLSRETSEDIASFIVRLRRQASLCEFENTDIDSVTNQLLRDQLINGIKSPKLTEHIMYKKSRVVANETLMLNLMLLFFFLR